MTEPERLPTMAKKVTDPEPTARVQPTAPPESVPSLPDAAPVAGAAPEQPAPPVRRAPATVRETVAVMDTAWVAFRDSAARFPAERMDEHLTDGGWTRKQMLAHISAWHDLTTERLGKFAIGGKPVPLEVDEDTINARVARQAIGKTAGEVLKDMEATYNKLRRRLLGMTDAQLAAHRAWAVGIIAGNTHDHYAEHMADIYVPEPVEAQKRRR